MSRTQRESILLALSAFLVVGSAAYAAPSPLTLSLEVVPDGLSVVYDAPSGNLSVRGADGASMMSAFEARSESGLFTGECDDVGGPFDVCNDVKIFKLDTAGFDTADFGAAVQPNLAAQTLLDDLLVDGASVGGDFDTGSGMYLVYVPEPTSLAMFALGAILLACQRGRK